MSYYSLISLMPKTPAVDPDAQAFITAAAITDPTQKSAIITLVTDLKAYGIWTKFKAIYPIVGGTASQHKYNLKDPRDLDAAFRLNFSTGWTHSSTGMLPNGTSAFADTFLNTSTQLNVNSHSFGMYSRTNNTTGSQAIGSFDNTPRFLQNNLSLGNFVSGLVSSIISYTANPSTSLLMLTRTSSTLSKAFRAGVLLGQETVTMGTLPTFTFYLGARNNAGTPALYSSHQCAFAFIGDGLTDTEAANFYTAVQAFQTTLGRSIGTQTVSDADAQAFINAAAIDDQVQANAINNLVIGMKADGLWTKMKAIYPVVGGIASSHAVNLKTPGTYNLTNLNTGWTHDSNGMTSLNTFAGTGIQPSTVLGLDDAHLSYFTTGFIDSTQACMIGAYTAPNGILIYSGNGIYGVNTGTFTSYNVGISGTPKFRITSRLSSTVQKFANNGTIYSGTAVSTLRPTTNILLARLGGATDYFNGICKFASVGYGLTDTDMTNFNTAVTVYQTALSRYN
jgi:hypothetical protein